MINPTHVRLGKYDEIHSYHSHFAQSASVDGRQSQYNPLIRSPLTSSSLKLCQEGHYKALTVYEANDRDWSTRRVQSHTGIHKLGVPLSGHQPAYNDYPHEMRPMPSIPSADATYKRETPKRRTRLSQTDIPSKLSLVDKTFGSKCYRVYQTRLHIDTMHLLRKNQSLGTCCEE